MSAFSDYALRILMSLAATPDRRMTSRELAQVHGLSFDHIAKVAQFLVREGFVEATRGRRGGLQLAKPAAEIAIGDVLRRTEAGTGPVECLRTGTEARCILLPVCGLKAIMANAQEAFYAALDSRSIADTLPNPTRVHLVLQARRP